MQLSKYGETHFCLLSTELFEKNGIVSIVFTHDFFQVLFIN